MDNHGTDKYTVKKIQLYWISFKTDEIIILLNRMLVYMYVQDFPGDSDGKESACNVRDQGLIPGSGRSPEEGNGYPHQYSWGLPGGSDYIGQILKLMK